MLELNAFEMHWIYIKGYFIWQTCIEDVGKQSDKNLEDACNTKKAWKLLKNPENFIHPSFSSSYDERLCEKFQVKTAFLWSAR